MLRRLSLVACALIWSATAMAAGIVVRDDAGNEVRLTHPARRIVSLAPHATELLFAAGAGPFVVGVSSYSNFPEAARKITSIGRIGAVDIEKILTLKPDLVVAWQSGNAASQIQTLRTFGIPVFESQPADYATIASSLERLGALSNTPDGARAAVAFRKRNDALTRTYRNRSPVSVFYQIWSQPLMTLSGKHMASAVLRTCGGRNIFDGLAQLAPTVSVESVVAANPDIILAPDDGGEHPLAPWRRFNGMRAVAQGNLLTVHADWINRPGPRILDAVEEICTLLDTVRDKQSHPSMPGVSTR